jgi:Ca2+-binding EF-hand superfamily protein
MFALIRVSFQYDEMLKIVSAYFRMSSSLEATLPDTQNTPEKRTQHLFELMDVNKDGKISLDEFKRGVKLDPTILGAITKMG